MCPRAKRQRVDKVGIICEGANQGGDMQVFRHFVRTLLGQQNIDVVPLGNKPNLFDKCGTTARALLDSGCHRVLIVWDLLPSWGAEPATVAANEAAVRASLLREDLHRHPCIFLIAIDRELETWLVADSVALSAVVPRPPNSVTVRAIRAPLKEANPKKWLMRKFSDIGRRSYLPERNAVEIARAMPNNLRAVSKIPSFLRFKDSLAQPC